MESKKTNALRSANRHSRANESEPARPMVESAYTAPAYMPDVTPAAMSRGTGQGCGALRSGLSANYRPIFAVTIFHWDQIVAVTPMSVTLIY